MPGDAATYRVVGILEGDGPTVGTLGRTVIVPLRTAQAVFDQDAITRVDLALGEGADADAVATALEGRLLVEPYVLSSPADLAASLRSSTADFQATTALIAAIALFTGAFLIFNTLSMTLVERARELGLLRAAGATRRPDHRVRPAAGALARSRRFGGRGRDRVDPGSRDGRLGPDGRGRDPGRAQPAGFGRCRWRSSSGSS